MSKVEEIVGMIEGMTVLELSELSKSLQDKFGVTAAVPMAAVEPLSFDPRFGRERAAERARTVASTAVDRIRAFWSKRTGR